MAILQQAQIDQYHRDGYTVLEKALDAEEIATLRARVEDIAGGNLPFPEANIEFAPNAPRERHIDNLRKINDPANHDGFFIQHASKRNLLDAASALLGPDIKLFGDQLFVKGPGGMEKTYHQDSAYFHIEPMALAYSVWLARVAASAPAECANFTLCWIGGDGTGHPQAVSYTHLTLPTNREV